VVKDLLIQAEFSQAPQARKTNRAKPSTEPSSKNQQQFFFALFASGNKFPALGTHAALAAGVLTKTRIGKIIISRPANCSRCCNVNGV
jgi:hypothetical protein